MGQVIEFYLTTNSRLGATSENAVLQGTKIRKKKCNLAESSVKQFRKKLISQKSKHFDWAIVKLVLICSN